MTPVAAPPARAGTALVSWSGGKDSCLALWRAQRAGVPVRRLLTALDESGQRARSHGVSPMLLRAQARALGLELRSIATSWADYEAHFVTALQQARSEGIDTAVFGDIDLQPHREWEEQVCARAGLQALLPLWGEARARLVDEFLDAGFRAVVVCVDGRHLDERFAGRPFDRAFLADLPAGVDACGENGEFHTFVTDGPNFSQPVALRAAGRHRWQAPPQYGGGVFHFGLFEPA